MKKRQSFKQFLLVFVLVILFTNISFNKQDNAESKEEIEPYCNGLDYEIFKESFNTPPRKIDVMIPQSKNFYENLANAQLRGNYINDKFKKQLYGYVTVYYQDFVCEFKAKIRISGDWKDHINLDNYSSSLDISLLEGNIQGITKFKLFLPRTRNFNNEIFVTTLLKEFDVLTPRTFNINVNLNNFFEGIYIFQEKIAKELIESNNLRESLIIESDETFVWINEKDLYYRTFGDSNNKSIILGKYLNNLWISKNHNNYKIFKEATGLFNRSYYSSINDRFNLNSESFDNFEISKFETLSIALNFTHGTLAHNRKFYFDKFSNQFLPIYYDGDSTFLDKSSIHPKNEILIKPFMPSIAKILLETKIDLVKLRAQLNLNGYIISEENLQNLIDDLFSNLEILSSQKIVKTKNIQNLENTFLTDEINKKVIFSSKNKLVECTNKTTIICKDYKKESFELTNSIINQNTLHFGDYDSFFNGEINVLKKTIINGINLYSVEEPIFQFDEAKNILHLTINNINQRYKVVFDNQISNLYIDLEILDNINPYLSNNEFLLTGCLTIYNSEISNLRIKVNNSFCEDALNIISSKGYLDSIEITNSYFDALDIDYSEIKINNIDISKAGNDCIDLSKGIYEIDTIEAENCFDKGISIGENSNVDFNLVDLNNTKTALAIKDFSIVKINNLKTLNSEYCLKIYQKKQEFGPSKAIIKNFFCDSEFYVENGSILEQ